MKVKDLINTCADSYSIRVYNKAIKGINSKRRVKENYEDMKVEYWFIECNTNLVIWVNE